MKSEFKGTMPNYRVGQSGFPADSGKLAALLAVKATDDFALDENRESFIEPKVFEIGVRHQVARPAMSNLMGNHVDQRAVPCLCNLC